MKVLNKLKYILTPYLQKFSPAIKFATGIQAIWIEDRPTRMAAALAYYSMFSLAPIIFVALTVAGIFLNELPLEQMFGRLEETFGSQTAQYLQDIVINIAERASGGSTLTTLIGFIALFYAASGLFVQLKYSLNTIWQAPMPSYNGIIAFIFNRLIAFVFVIGVGLFIVAINVLNIVVSILGSFVPIPSSLPIANGIIFLSLLAFSFALLFKILPDAKIRWGDVWIGALLTAVIFSIGRWLVGFYLSHSNISSAFDAAGMLAVLLVAVYYLAQIFLFGAVFTRVYALQFGSQLKITTGRLPPTGETNDN